MAIISRIEMLGILFGRSKKSNVDEAAQDVIAAPAPVDHQQEDPDNVSECKENKEDDFQVENESQEEEGEEKLPIATRTRSSRDSNNESGASADKVFPRPQDGLREDPTPQQRRAWSKEGACSSCGRKDHKRKSNRMCPFYRKDVVSSVTTERKKRAVRDEGEKGPTVSKKPVPVRKCKKGKWNRFGEGLKIPVPEGGGDGFYLGLHSTSSGNDGGGEESQDDEEKLEESLYYTPTVSPIRPDIKTTDLKGDMKGWVQVDVINKKYVPVIDMKSDEFKDNETEIEFAVRKPQCGPIQYETKPTVGMLIDKYLPPSFLEDVVKHSNDYVA